MENDGLAFGVCAFHGTVANVSLDKNLNQSVASLRPGSYCRVWRET